jgi:hypothetical protein
MHGRAGHVSWRDLVHLQVRDPENPETTHTLKLFADSQDVAGITGTPRRGHPIPAHLRVEVIKKTKGMVLVNLPQPAVPDAVRVLINEDDVLAKEEVPA